MNTNCELTTASGGVKQNHTITTVVNSIRRRDTEPHLINITSLLSAEVRVILEEWNGEVIHCCCYFGCTHVYKVHGRPALGCVRAAKVREGSWRTESTVDDMLKYSCRDCSGTEVVRIGDVPDVGCIRGNWDLSEHTTPDTDASSLVKLGGKGGRPTPSGSTNGEPGSYKLGCVSVCKDRCCLPSCTHTAVGQAQRASQHLVPARWPG